MAVEFIKGLLVKKPSEQAPDFVKCKLSFKVADIVLYLKEKANEAGYVNVDVLESREGKYYAKLDDYKKSDDAPVAEVKTDEPVEGIRADELKDDEPSTEDIPF